MIEKARKLMYKAHNVKVSPIALGYLQGKVDQWLDAALQKGIINLPPSDYVLRSYVRDHLTVSLQSEDRIPYCHFVLLDDLDTYINNMISVYELDLIIVERALLVLDRNNDVYRQFAEQRGFCDVRENMRSIPSAYWDYQLKQKISKLLIFARSLLLLDELHSQAHTEDNNKIIEKIAQSISSHMSEVINVATDLVTIDNPKELTIHYEVDYDSSKLSYKVWLSCNNKHIDLRRKMGNRYREFLVEVIRAAMTMENITFIPANTTVQLNPNSYLRKDGTVRRRKYLNVVINDNRIYKIDHINQIVRGYVQLSNKKKLRCFSQHKHDIIINVNIKFHT